MKYKLAYSPEFRAEIKKLIGDTRLILGSNSPRRAEILRLLDLKFEKIVPEIDENISLKGEPSGYAERLAILKAEALKGIAAGVIITADTIVVLDDQIINKPGDDKEARTMLESLSGRTHGVITAIALKDVSTGKVLHAHSESRVKFFNLPAELVQEYIAGGEPFGKAGAYAIQGAGGNLVESYEGELDNIIGFPARLFRDLFYKLRSEV
jgi:septum formation protein